MSWAPVEITNLCHNVNTHQNEYKDSYDRAQFNRRDAVGVHDTRLG